MENLGTDYGLIAPTRQKYFTLFLPYKSLLAPLVTDQTSPMLSYLQSINIMYKLFNVRRLTCLEEGRDRSANWI